jgi:hypothetical protein
MQAASERIRTIDLGHDQVLIVEAGHGGRVQVLSGSAWLTAEGETSDNFLCAGGELPLRRGRTVIEGLVPGRVRITEPAARATAWQAAWWGPLWRGFRRQVARLQLGPEVVELPI